MTIWISETIQQCHISFDSTNHAVIVFVIKCVKLATAIKFGSDRTSTKQKPYSKFEKQSKKLRFWK